MKRSLWFALTLLVVAVTNCTEKTPEPTPIADFSYTSVYNSVGFDNESLYATSYLWSFGDGSTSTEEYPVHTYSSSGSYIVKLVAKGAGGSDQVSKTITIQSATVPGTGTGTTPPGNPGTSTGTFSFWMQQDAKVGAVDVYVSGSFAGSITQYHSNGITCGQGNVNVTKSPGTYAWTAKGATGGSWSGTITIEAGKCGTMRLDPATTTTPTQTNGTYSFWTRADLKYGNISVNVGGTYVGAISHYHSNGVNCGAADVNVTKLAGTYAWTAKGTTGGSWSGTISIQAGKCGTLELTR